MSHTKIYGSQNQAITVIVNSDWSGDAILKYHVPSGSGEVVLPGEVIKAIFEFEARRVAVEAFCKLVGYDV